MKTFFKLSTVGIVLLLVAAACGSSDNESSNNDTPNETNGVAEAGIGTHVCQERIIIQTDWFPEPEHAYLYQLIGAEGAIDTQNGTYAGNIKGTDLTLEIRAGGPYIDNTSPSAQFYSDTSIYMAYVNTSIAIDSYTTTPVVAIFANFEVGPQILMWNPERYSFESFEDIGESDATVLHFGGASYINYLIGRGIVDEGNTDASYDGSPARFIASDGGIVQQGFATSEPYRYLNDFEDWGKEVDFLLIHDSGHTVYQSALSVRPETVEEDADCLEFLVPIIQQGLVDYMDNPEPINIRLDEIVKALDSFWESSIPAHNWSTQQMKDLGLVTDGNNNYVGDMDEARIQKLIDELTPILREDNVDGFDEGDPPLMADTIFTNRFLDRTISLGY